MSDPMSAIERALVKILGAQRFEGLHEPPTARVTIDTLMRSMVDALDAEGSNFHGGITVVVSRFLPLPMPPREWARRFVRHAFAEAGVLEWLGEEPGPRPDAQTHAVWVGPNTVHVSRRAHALLTEAPASLARTEANRLLVNGWLL